MASARRRLHEKRPRWRWHSLAIGLISLTCSSTTLAQDKTRPPDKAPALTDVRPIVEAIELGESRCLEKKPLARHVAMWLQKDAIDRRIQISVTDTAEGVRFVVRRDGQVIGERTLEVKKVPCEEIHAALGLGVASAIDATVLTSLGISPPEPPPAPAAPEPPPKPPTPPPLPPQPGVWIPPPGLSPGFGPMKPVKKTFEHKPPYFTAAVEAEVLIDLLPNVTLGIAPSAELTVIRGFDLRLSALATPSGDVDVLNAADQVVGQASVGLVAGRLDGCAAISMLEGTARLRGCAGLLAGAVHASGVNLLTNLSTVSPWIAPAVRGDARWALTRNFGMVVGLDGFFPGLRPRLLVVNKNGDFSGERPFPLAGVATTFGPSLTF